jgi:ABC-type glutathione transport system ATPase component
MDLPFWRAPGFSIALGVSALPKLVKGPATFVAILPVIVTPLVGSLILFRMFSPAGIPGATIQTIAGDPTLLPRFSAALSGGQRQRAAVGRAILREPNAAPLSTLDAKLRVSTRAQIRTLHHALPTTTVSVTHDQIEAITLADRAVVTSHGRVQQVGAPTDIHAGFPRPAIRWNCRVKRQ